MMVIMFPTWCWVEKRMKETVPDSYVRAWWRYANVGDCLCLCGRKPYIAIEQWEGYYSRTFPGKGLVSSSTFCWLFSPTISAFLRHWHKKKNELNTTEVKPKKKKVKLNVWLPNWVFWASYGGRSVWSKVYEINISELLSKSPKRQIKRADIKYVRTELQQPGQVEYSQTMKHCTKGITDSGRLMSQRTSLGIGKWFKNGGILGGDRECKLGLRTEPSL